VTAAGAPAPPRFWFPNACEDLDVGGAGPPVPISGLALSLRPARYGTGSDPIGGAPVPAITLAQELIGMNEESVVLNPFFRVGVKDATPFGTGFLVFGTSAPCAPLNFKGCDLYVNPTFFLVLPAGGAPLGAAGDAFVPLGLGAIACDAPILGVSVHVQWLISRPAAAGGGWETSEGLVFTIGEK